MHCPKRCPRRRPKHCLKHRLERRSQPPCGADTATPARRHSDRASAAPTLRPTAITLSAMGAFVAMAMAMSATGASAQSNAAPEAKADAQRVEIVGTSPLPGLGVDRDVLPYSAVTIQRGRMDAVQADTTTDFLATRMPGMQVNDIQGSPFQADLTFRGYRASGLLGAAQGLSVYLDGVRVNEAFGDVVNWDLVPEFAVSSLSLVSSANPSFGLNTLGGAIAIQTVDGRSAPGAEATLRLGSHGRVQVHAGLGQSHGAGWHSWIGGTRFQEDGWRDHSDGRQTLVMAKLGRAMGDAEWSASLLAGRTTLVGNGLTPAYTLDDDGNATPDLLAQQRSAVFTHPDQTRNALGQITLQYSRKLAHGALLQALAYARHTDRDTVNGDLADDDDDDDEDTSAAPAAAAAALVPDPMRHALADDDEAAEAALNTTHSRQRAWGLAVSLAQRTGAHQWQVGASVDASRVRFDQLEQDGTLDAVRGVIAGAADAEQSVAVTGQSSTLGLYATDTWTLRPDTHVTATLRANRARVSNTLSTADEVTGELVAKPNETFTYHSLNPALGVAHRVQPGLTAFANVARNTRVPTVIELGCADPDEPCRLPAGLQSDPYLKPVRATSVEAGIRWRPAPGHRVEWVFHRTDNRDDILFGSVSTTGQLGYFRNVDRTRHQGMDVSWEGRQGPWSATLGYSLLSATYESAETLRMGERNVTITPGTRMAGLPHHALKASLDWRGAQGWGLGADLQAVGARGVLGNEDGLLADDGDGIHRLQVPGHALVHLRASWQPNEWVKVGLRVANAFDRQTASFGALAETPFDANGDFTGVSKAAVFQAPGAPRTLMLSVTLTY